MKEPAQFELESAVREWRDRLSQSPQFRAENLNELESHLRDSIAVLCSQRLTDEEAFLVATHRVGSTAALEPEFAKVNAKEVWLNRVLWMLLGIPVWSLISGLAAFLSRPVVRGGRVGVGYTFQRDSQSFLGIPVMPAVLYAFGYLVTVALVVWAVWRLAGWINRKWPSAVSTFLRRPGLLTFGVLVSWLLLVGGFSWPLFQTLFLKSLFTQSGFAAAQLAASLSWWVISPLQTLAFLATAAVLARRLFLQKPQRA